MANSTTHLDLIAQSQASKEVTANAFFDAASQATLYGRQQSSSSGLTWGYYGGTPTLSSGSQATIANGTLTLTASTTCYIVALKSSGAVSFLTSNTNWNNTTDYWRLYSVVVGSATVTSYTDARELGKMTGGGGGSAAAITVKDEGSNLTTSLASIDFVGTGVTATNTGDAVTVTVNTPTSITAKDEGVSLTTTLSSLDFAGAGVTATNTGGDVTVTISGGSNIAAKDEGTTLTSAVTSLNFAGAGVVATNSSGDVTVTVAAAGREKLSAARTYYVRTNGSDSNTGLSDTSGAAFLTMQKAMDVISGTLDLAGYVVTIKLADGTYTGGLTTKPLLGGYKVTVSGNSGTPANVLISTTSASAFTNSIPNFELSVENLKITTTTSGSSLFASRGGEVKWSNVNFGACAGNHISTQFGSRALCYGNYEISGATTVHWDAYQNGYIECAGKTVTVTGTPALSTFASSVHMSELYVFNNTFTGSATGTRYAANNFGFIFVNGAATTIFPGNAAGTADGASYGRYA